MRPVAILLAVAVSPGAFGFVQPRSRVCAAASVTRTFALNEGVRTGMKAFLVGSQAAPTSPPVAPIVIEAQPQVDDNLPLSLASSFFESTPFSSSKLPAFLSNPGSIGDKIGAELNQWGGMFRAGAERSWQEVGGGLRESAADSANLLFQASKNSIQYFATELAVSWESQTETRRALAEEGKLVGDSLRDLGPYVQSNAAASWESSTSLREGAQQVAASVGPFVERCLSYFATNAATSWDATGSAWRDDVVQTTSTSVQGFGPYFLNNLASSWEASEPIRPVVGCLLVGSWLVLQLRQRKAKEIAKPTKVASNPLQPFLQSSVASVQAAVDKTKKIPLEDLLRQTTATAKASPIASKKTSSPSFLTNSIAPNGMNMGTRKGKENPALSSLFGAVVASKGKKVTQKIRLKTSNMKKQMSFSFK